MYQPENRPIAEALLIANIPGMSPALAAKTYDIVLSPSSGFFRGALLELRSRYGKPHRDLTDPMKYVDLSYLERAGSAPK